MIPLHPLINAASTHYDTDKRSAIEELEEELTVAEMIGACKFNIFKYEFRQDAKGQKEADIKKIETYKNYLRLLEYLDLISSDLFTVAEAMKADGLKYRYR